MSPRRALRPCAQPGCAELVRAGRCRAHERVRQRQADTKTPEARAFYGSGRWKRYRARYVKLHPLCVPCQAKGRLAPTEVVDHIVPMEQGGDPWDPANHQSICERCHAQKRGKERWGK